jgi:hypothetical protein
MLENIINKTVHTNQLLYFFKSSLGSEEVPEGQGVVIDAWICLRLSKNPEIIVGKGSQRHSISHRRTYDCVSNAVQNEAANRAEDHNPSI